MICEDEYIRLIHQPFLKDFKMRKYLEKGMFLNLKIQWQKISTYKYKYTSTTLMEDGICTTFNQIDANLIFRNDTVDPKFIKEFQIAKNDIDPKFWNFEEGFTQGEINSYPVRAIDIGIDSGFGVDLAILEPYFPLLETTCRRNPKSTKIYLHHPVDVYAKNFLSVPFNKSATILVKPEMSKTSGDLRKYDPSM